VTKESFWKTVFKTPSAARTATVVMLVTWLVAAVWGGFFVEPTVLRDSQAARDYVEWASKVFPWLDNIRRLVPQAEMGLYLHSVYTVALAPLSVTTAVIIALRPLDNDLSATQSAFKNLRDTCVVFGILAIGILGLYNGILQPSFGKLHRTGYSFVVNPFTVPIVAPFFIMGLWHVFTGGTYFAYLSVRKLMSTKSRHS
jgi:hypothetical protein